MIFKKYSFIILTSLFSFVSLNAHAGTTGVTKISVLVPWVTSFNLQVANGQNNPAGCSNSEYMTVDPALNSDEKKALISSLIAAFHSQKSVNIYTSGCVPGENSSAIRGAYIYN